MARSSSKRTGKHAITKRPNAQGKETPKQKFRRKAPSDDEEITESDAYVDEDSDNGSTLSVDSDAIDESDFETSAKSGKRKRASMKKSSPKKHKPTAKKHKKEEEYDDLEDGQEVVGTVVEAPKTGRVPPGQISQNTLDFLRQLQDPECNDRTWFKLHEPVYRLAEKEWKDFIDEFTQLLVEADPQIPPLPPNDVLHRIYRDIRFSNDKTPYKTGLSASFSRSGRKGIFAGYHLCIKPSGSFFAAGTWCPGKNELQTIRSHILRSSRRLKQAISAPGFVALYGEPKHGPPDQERQNIFGREDELKVAPKGVDKNHKDIKILKCRSFAVSHRFTDEEVLDPDFKQKLGEIVETTRPFVHLLNNMMTVEPDEEDESDTED